MHASQSKLLQNVDVIQCTLGQDMPCLPISAHAACLACRLLLTRTAAHSAMAPVSNSVHGCTSSDEALFRSLPVSCSLA